MDAFKSMLAKITTQPAMYVGECSLRAVSHYISGYCHALEDLGCLEKPLHGWLRWVELRFMISSPAWHWTRILVHAYGSDRAALDAIPSLYEEFLTQRSSMGVQGIEAELKRRLIAEFGEDGHVPKTTNTKNPL